MLRPAGAADDGLEFDDSITGLKKAGLTMSAIDDIQFQSNLANGKSRTSTQRVQLGAGKNAWHAAEPEEIGGILRNGST